MQCNLLVFKVHWAKDNLDGYMNFYSCSGDGRVTNWTIVKTSLWFSDLLVVNFKKELQNFKNPVPMTDGVRTFAFKPDDDTVYLIGTEVIMAFLVFMSVQIALVTGGGHPPRDHRVLYRLPDDLQSPRHPS